MRRAWVPSLIFVVLTAAVAAVGQEEAAGLPDPFRLLERKAFVARRASSNNPDPGPTTTASGRSPERRSCSRTSRVLAS